ncbi:MAG TPA: BT_2262 family domain-containing protein [Paludibacter sp.]
MKKIILITLVVAFAFSACTKEESMGVSTVTTYATMTLNGAQDLFWPMNTPFVDPGCVAFEGTTDISSKITTTASVVDVTKGGKYTVNYKVLNGDGFAATTSRTVYVYDATAPLNGYYQSKIKRDNAGTIANRGPFTVMIFGVGNSKYFISDLLGGWYEFGNTYGSSYAGQGVLKLNGDNTFTIISASKLPWGYPCVLTDVSTYDPATKTLVLKTNMEDVPTMKFTVTLNNPTSLN